MKLFIDTIVIIVFAIASWLLAIATPVFALSFCTFFLLFTVAETIIKKIRKGF